MRATLSSCGREIWTSVPGVRIPSPPPGSPADSALPTLLQILACSRALSLVGMCLFGSPEPLAGGSRPRLGPKSLGRKFPFRGCMRLSHRRPVRTDSGDGFVSEPLNRLSRPLAVTPGVGRSDACSVVARAEAEGAALLVPGHRQIREPGQPNAPRQPALNGGLDDVGSQRSEREHHPNRALGNYGHLARLVSAFPGLSDALRRISWPTRAAVSRPQISFPQMHARQTGSEQRLFRLWGLLRAG
jgi:hypothetical protein